MSKSMTKISAVMLAVMTLLSSIFVVPANAAAGDKVTISFNYCYDTNGNLIKYQQTTVNDGYTVGSAGDELLITYVDGREAYCIQPGHSLYAGDQLTEGSSSTWNSLGTAKQNTINLALLCGKPGSVSSLPGNSDEKWAATQLIVWEIVSGCRETSGSYNCTNTKYINGITAGGANSGVRSAYNQIVSNMQTLRKIPSFAADSTGNAKTYEMNASGSSYFLTLTDSNSVLGKFDFKSTGGVTVSRSGNKLTLTAKSPINNAVTLSASKSVSGASVSLIAYGDSGLQDVVSGASGITVSAYFKVKATPGSLKLVKTSEDGKVSGIKFTVKGTNYNKTVKTNTKGEFTLSDLVPGTYTVTEKEDSRYEKQSPKTVKVESGKTASVSFKNTLRTGGLKIIKTSDDGIVANIEFTVKGTNYNKTAKSNSKGEILLSDLVPGTYTVTEKVDARYEAQAPKTVAVEADKTATVKFKNTLRTGGLRIIKTSDDGIVADIEFTVTGKNYSKTAKSDKNGEIQLSDLIPGTYTVTEKVDARYEAQAPKTVTVEADKTATVKFKNTLRTGDLKIIKTSDDGIVADIEFTVTGKNYSKTAKSDKNGEIHLADLIPGTYTVTEKVDARYEAQAPKTVTVEADKTATVKFKNTLRKGGLRIIKTSDDGIVANIEFTVKGTNYNKTAKSNSKGEILISDLIPGIYTVTEKVDARYEAQAPQTVTVEADKTATVKFKNTLRKGGLKIIKTSDDGIVADIEFTITGTNYSKTAKSDKNGEIRQTPQRA